MWRLRLHSINTKGCKAVQLKFEYNVCFSIKLINIKTISCTDQAFIQHRILYIEINAIYTHIQ